MSDKIKITIPKSLAGTIQAQTFIRNAQGELPSALPLDLVDGENAIALDAGQGVNIFVKPEALDD